METTVAGLLQRSQPQRGLADARFALHEQASRLIVHRVKEVSYPTNSAERPLLPRHLVHDASQQTKAQ